MVMAGSRPNQSQSQSVGSTPFGNSHYPQQQNQYINDNYQNSSNAGVPVSGQSQSVGSTLLGNTVIHSSRINTLMIIIRVRPMLVYLYLV